MKRPLIAITMGDPGGVGPEVIAKALKSFPLSRACDYLLFGIPEVFDYLKKKCRLTLRLHPVSSIHPADLNHNTLNFIDISREACRIFQKGLLSHAPAKPTDVLTFDIGKVTYRNGALAFAALKVAADLAAKGKVAAIVTAPVNKSAMRLVDPGFCGHTEYLAGTSHTKSFAMMFVSDKLKLTLVTIHIPLKDVARKLSAKLIYEKIRLTHEFLKRRFKIAKPRIGVCALNPHGPETGSEEKRVIEPAVLRAQKEGIGASGPFSADQLFYAAYEKQYDALISMYHDQGLGPFKMVSFHDGVNVTLGLPYVRTSPDHGTAFNIAYQGKADASSMLAALRLAKNLVCP